MQVKQFCVLTIESRVPVLSKAVVLLLLIYYLMYFPLFVGVLCLSLFCYALLCVLSSFVTIFTRKRVLVAFIVLWMSCYRKCFFLAVPWVGLQCVIVVCPYHTHFCFLLKCCCNGCATMYTICPFFSVLMKLK